MNRYVRNAIFCATMILGVCATSFAQQQVVPIWPGVAPGSEKWTQKEVNFVGRGNEAMVRNVVQPTLTVYRPAAGTANGTAIIIAPGGGFLFLSWQNEGADVAAWLSQHGVTAFILKYRVRDTGTTDEELQQKVTALVGGRGRGSGAAPSPAPAPRPASDMSDILPIAVADGLQAVKVVRQRAAEWNIAPDRIGLMGFSAGAMLTTGAITSYTAENRPNFAASIYDGTVDPSKVPADAPPLFIACASDDSLLPSTGSAALYSAWRSSGHSAELHIYSKGGHGFGMHKQNLPLDHWIDRFSDWLELQGLLKTAH